MGRSSGFGRGGRGRGRDAWGLLAASAVLIAGAAFAQTAPAPASPDADFPASNSESDILHWIAARTSIPRSTILMIEPRAVVALAGRSQPGTAGGPVHAEVREELLGTDSKTRSASFSVDLDCAGHQFRIVQRKIFTLPNLQGEGQDNPEAAPWAAVNEAAPVGKAWKAVCTNDFVFPYAGVRTAAAAPSLQQPIATALRSSPPPTTPPPPRPTAKPAPETPVRKLASAAPSAALAPPAPPRPVAATPAAAGGAFEVVLGSYTVRENAVAASAKLDTALASEMAGRRKALAPATVRGKAYTVLTVSGFPTPSDAADFCKAAKAIPLACLVKKGAPG